MWKKLGNLHLPSPSESKSATAACRRSAHDGATIASAPDVCSQSGRQSGGLQNRRPTKSHTLIGERIGHAPQHHTTTKTISLTHSTHNSQALSSAPTVTIILDVNISPFSGGSGVPKMHQKHRSTHAPKHRLHNSTHDWAANVSAVRALTHDVDNCVVERLLSMSTPLTGGESASAAVFWSAWMC